MTTVLSDDERLALDVDNNRRLSTLVRAGVPMPDPTPQLLVELFRELMTPEQFEAARERHLFFVANRLDIAEEQYRKHTLANGLVVGQ